MANFNEHTQPDKLNGQSSQTVYNSRSQGITNACAGCPLLMAIEAMKQKNTAQFRNR